MSLSPAVHTPPQPPSANASANDATLPNTMTQADGRPLVRLAATIDDEPSGPTRRAMLAKAGAAFGATLLASSVAEPTLAQAAETSPSVPLTAAALSAPQQAGTPHRVVTMIPSDTSVGPFTWEIGDTLFNGVRDTVSYLGYNGASGGNRVNTSEPRLTWNVEANYRPGPGANWVETYWEYQNPAGNIILRPVFFQFDRNATTPNTALVGAHYLGNPLSFELPNGRLLAMMSSSGMKVIGDAGQDAVLEVDVDPGHTPQFILRSGGASWFSLEASADYLSQLRVSGHTVVDLMHYGGTAMLAVGNENQDLSQVGLFQNSGPRGSIKALVARASSTQSGSLFEVQDANGAPLSRFDKDGCFMTNRHAPPADSDLAGGELALWFDQTSGVAKLMVKAKDAGGVVRTASVALA